MKKSIALLALSIALVLSLAACGGEGNNTPVHIHKFGEWIITRSATCTADGTQTRYCSCGEKQTEVIIALGHNPGEAVVEDKIDATYDADGSYQLVVYCSVSGCGAELERTTNTLDMLVHHPGSAVVENEIAATCYTEGSYDEVVYCLDEDCGHKELSRKTVTVSMLAHTPAEAVVENLVNATCTINGSYDEVIYCSDENCKVQISRTTKVIDTLGHNFADGACTLCGEADPDYVPETPKYSEGFKYALKADGESYSVTGRGTCTDTDIFIPDTYNGLPVTSIGDWVFDGCTSLTSIVIPDSVTSIGNFTFRGCNSLMSIVIPDSVTSIGVHTFYGCTSLTSIVIPDNVTIIRDGAFADCTGLTSITVNENNTAYKSIDGNLYTKDGKTLVQYAIGKKSTSFTIPDSVTSIGDYAFYFCNSLTSVVIGDSVTSIGDWAFYYCTGLTSIEIPDSVTSIGGCAFLCCTGLIQKENGVSYVDKWVIDCDTTVSAIALRSNTVGIGDDAFYNCTGLTSIVIPNSATSIGNGAFLGCTCLKDVYYTGTAAEWAKINIDSYGNYYLTNATIHYNYVPEN